MGWIKTILFGIGGSMAATYGGQALGLYQAGQGAGFIGSVVGAVVLLMLGGGLGTTTTRLPFDLSGRR